MTMRSRCLKVAGVLLILFGASRSTFVRADILNGVLDGLIFKPAQDRLINEANGIIDRFQSNPNKYRQTWQDNERWIIDTQRCFGLPDKTRFFLYRRFSEVAMGQSQATQARLVEKFSQLAFLTCRETSGRVVAEVAHNHEDETGAARYGNTYEDLQNAISKLVSIWKRAPRAGYFDRTTNAGLFQLSADFIDDTSTERKSKLLHWYENKIWEMERMDRFDLQTYCGSEEFYSDDLSSETSSKVRALARRFRDRAWGESLFTNSKNGVDDLILFHQLQSICPGHHLDLAKEVLMLYGNAYFGPLNNTRNSGSCGSSHYLCQKTFETIASELNAKKNVIDKL